MSFTLTEDVLESGEFGNKFNGTTDADGIISGTFTGGTKELELSLQGYDIDYADEVEVFVNGASIGFLGIGVNNGLSSHVVHIPLASQIAGENSIAFHVTNPNWKWGITDLLLTEVAGPEVTPLVEDVLESGEFGNKFNGATDDDGVFTATFTGGTKDLELSLQGYDIDTGSEIEIFLNGTSIGFLDAGVNNGLSSHVIDLPLASQIAGENTISFEVTNPNWKWGVTDLLLSEPAGPEVTVLVEDVLESGEFGNKFNGATDDDGVFTATFTGGTKNLELSLQGYDIDYADEVEVFVNGASVGYLEVGVNNGLSPHVIDIPLSIQVAGENTVSFEVANANWKWGVTDLLLTEGPPSEFPFLVEDVLQTGEYGNKFNEATNEEGVFMATFAGGTKNLELSLQGYDIDFANEIEIFLNGASIGFLDVGVNNGFSSHVIDIPLASQIAGENTITFEVSNPTFKWGVTDLLLSEVTRTITVDLRDDVRSDVPIVVASQGVVFDADAHHFARSVSPPPVNGEIEEGSEIVWVAFNQSGTDAFILFDYEDPIQNVQWEDGLGALNRATPYPDQDDGIDGWGSDEIVTFSFDYDVTFIEADLTPLVNPQNSQTDNQTWRLFTDTDDDGTVDTISSNLTNFEAAPQVLGFTDDVIGFGAQRHLDSFAITTITLEVRESDLVAGIMADDIEVESTAGVVTLDVLRNDGAPLNLSNAITAFETDVDQDGTSDLAGTLTLAADGMSFDYDLGTAFDGMFVGQSVVEVFEYSMLGIDETTYTTTATITVEGQLEVITVEDAYTLPGVAGDVTLDVLVNDDYITEISAVTDPAQGSVTIAGDDQSLIYNPGTAFDGLFVGQTAVETFTYDVLGDDGATYTETVEVTIEGQVPVTGPITFDLTSTPDVNTTSDLVFTDSGLTMTMSSSLFVSDHDPTVFVAGTEYGSGVFAFTQEATPTENWQTATGAGVYGPPIEVDQAVDGWGDDEVLIFDFDDDVRITEVRLVPVGNNQNSSSTNQTFRMFIDEDDDGTLDAISPNTAHAVAVNGAITDFASIFSDASEFDQPFDDTGTVFGFGAQRATDSFYIESITVEIV